MYKVKKKILSLCFLGVLVSGVAEATASTVTQDSTQTSSKKLVAHKKHKKHKKTAPRNYMSGIASYYGGEDSFDGRRMANGDIFDASDINICAHPTLPLGTKLKVTNLSNGRSIYVEVTDRMPRGNKVIDLSKGGAKALGMHHHGVGRVGLVKINDSEFEHNQNNLEVRENDNGAPH